MYPTFLSQADGGNPRSWIPEPSLNRLIFMLVPSASRFLSLVIILVLATSAIRFVFSAVTSRHEQLAPEQRFVGDRGISTDIGIFISSRSPVRMDYLAHIETSICREVHDTSYAGLGYFAGLSGFADHRAWKIAIARGVGRELSPMAAVTVGVAIGVLWAFALILLVQPLTDAMSLRDESFPGMNDAKYGYRDLPIVTAHCHDFIKRFHYSPERSRYFYVMDWEAALDVRSGLSGPQEYKTMDALKRAYPEVFDDHIIQLSDFLSRHDRFLVLADTGYRPRWTAHLLHYPRWLDVRIQNNPAYQISTLGMIESNRLLLVEKVVAGGVDRSGDHHNHRIFR